MSVTGSGHGQWGEREGLVLPTCDLGGSWEGTQVQILLYNLLPLGSWIGPSISSLYFLNCKMRELAQSSLKSVQLEIL